MLFSTRQSLAFVIVTTLCLSFASAYKYLCILNTAARSHHIVGSALMKELARRGHDVTVVSPFPLKKPMKNYHDVPLPSIQKFMEKDMNNLLDNVETSIVASVVQFHQMGLGITEAVLNEAEVQALMKSNQKFDAVICEVFLSEALFGLSEHFNASLIGLGTFGAHPWNTDMVGSPSPPSYVPSALLRFTDHMTLTQRITNLAFGTFERLLLDWYYLPKQEAIYNKYFSHNKQSFYELRKNAALVLLNTHVSLSFPRPYVPNQIEVGGMHINPKREPLPEHIQKFIDEAEHGVIYFSMGSNLKSKNLPLAKREVILNTFRGLKQRVLWKFEEPNLPNKPANVLISDWFPQDDILAQPNVRLFITHGGLLSTTESIYHGKPFVGIPIFGDQFLNMARAELNGYGVMLDYLTLTTEDFTAAIQRILGDSSYGKLVQDMSVRFRDQPMKPIDKAVYWVEHVSRHNGAKYLHCAGLDLSFIQYHNIDAMLILFGGLFLVFLLLMLVIRAIWRWLLVFCFKPDNKVKRN